jgi:predicted RNA-binding protein with RPS1 domain
MACKDQKELEGKVSRVTDQGAFIKLIENGKETGMEYFAHLGDIQENETLLYDLRDQKLSDINTVYDHFVKLEEGQTVKFKEWDGNNRLHAFSVHDREKH